MVGGGGASCRKRVRAAAGRGAFAGSAPRGGAGARRRTTSGLSGRTPAALAARGVGAAAVERWGTARALLEVVSVHPGPVAGRAQFRPGDGRRPKRAAARRLDARATERRRGAGDGS